MNLLNETKTTKYMRGGGKNNLKDYNGSYRGGMASYSYYEKGDKRIYHGDFKLLLKSHDQLHGKEIEYAKGVFVDGYKQGVWTYYKNIGLVSHELKVVYDNGVFDGHISLKIKKKRFRFLKLLKKEAYLEGQMRQGKLVGMFNANIYGALLTASFNQDGIPNGLWQLDYSKEKNGKVEVNYELWNDGKRKDLWVYDNSTGKKKKGQVDIADFFMNFLYRECGNLTSIIKSSNNRMHDINMLRELLQISM